MKFFKHTKADITFLMYDYNEFQTSTGKPKGFKPSLFNLIEQADLSNRRKLMLSFPLEVHYVNIQQWGKEKAEEFAYKNGFKFDEVSVEKKSEAIIDHYIERSMEDVRADIEVSTWSLDQEEGQS
jgi:hypothetical protein